MVFVGHGKVHFQVAEEIQRSDTLEVNECLNARLGFSIVFSKIREIFCETVQNFIYQSCETQLHKAANIQNMVQDNGPILSLVTENNKN